MSRAPSAETTRRRWHCRWVARDTSVDVALAKHHQRAVAARRLTSSARLKQQNRVPAAQTPFVSESDCALFYELLPRFLPTGWRRTENAEGITKASNLRVADEFFHILTSSSRWRQLLQRWQRGWRLRACSSGLLIGSPQGVVPPAVVGGVALKSGRISGRAARTPPNTKP